MKKSSRSRLRSIMTSPRRNFPAFAIGAVTALAVLGAAGFPAVRGGEDGVHRLDAPAEAEVAALWPNTDDPRDNDGGGQREVGLVVWRQGPAEAAAIDGNARQGQDPRIGDAVATREVVATGPAGRWEAVFGNNIRLALAPESELEIQRRDVVAGVGCLTLHLRRGALRARVAFNAKQPEAVAISTPALETVLTRGDLVLAAAAIPPGDSAGGKAARLDAVAVLSGGTRARPAARRGRISPSTALMAGEGLSRLGAAVPARGTLAPDEQAAWRAGLSFLPERQRATLPPAPPEGRDGGGI